MKEPQACYRLCCKKPATWLKTTHSTVNSYDAKDVLTVCHDAYTALPLMRDGIFRNNRQWLDRPRSFI